MMVAERIVFDTGWWLGSCFFLSSVITQSEVATMHDRGPAYAGSFQAKLKKALPAAARRKTDAKVCNWPVVVVSSLCVAAGTV